MSPIILRDELSTLQLSLATFDTGDADVYLIAEASMKGFAGRNTSVGVTRRIWDAFIDEFKKLETTRTGEARLVSMSPADLEIRVRSYDRGRHIRVAGFVSPPSASTLRHAPVFGYGISCSVGTSPDRSSPCALP